MKVFLDASLMTPDSAVGRISGYLHLAAAPVAGSLVNLGKSDRAPLPPGYTGHLKIGSVIFEPVEDKTECGVQLLLDDVVAPSRENAIALGEYLRLAFGLDIEIYD